MYDRKRMEVKSIDIKCYELQLLKNLENEYNFIKQKLLKEIYDEILMEYKIHKKKRN